MVEIQQRRTAAHRTLIAALVVLVCLACAGPALGAPRGYARVEPVCQPPRLDEASCFALARVRVPASQAASPGVRPLAARPAALEFGPAEGLTPALLASAYGYDPNAGGSGETVAVVDAFNDPKMESDLAAFSSHYGLPSCTAETGCFRKVGQSGSAIELPAEDANGWSVEESLDVEMVHSACPKCRILLVEAKNAALANLGASVRKAVELGAVAVSNSYGAPEQGAAGPLEGALFEHPGVVITAATGDYGYDWWVGPLPDPQTTNQPASMPGVVSVGGTTLTLNSEGKRASEVVWNGNGAENAGHWQEGASGGGCSIFFEAPLWQRDAAGFGAAGCGTKRLSADVAAVADPLTGFDIYDTYNCGERCEALKGTGEWSTIGGTSVSSPFIASLYALAGGAHGVSDPALTLYGHLGGSSLFDVTSGGNGYCDKAGAACGINAVFGERLDCEGTTACNATSGFDGPSGVGAPASLSLFEPLLPKAAITPPAEAVAGTPATFSGSSSSDPYPGATRSYSWAFGDGQTGTGVSVAHTYAAAGEYTATLTVSDNYGLQSPPVTAKVVVAAPSKSEEEEAAKKAREAKEKAEAEKKAKEVKEEEAAKKAKEAKEKEEAEKKARETKERELRTSEAITQEARRVFEEAAARLKAEQEAQANQGSAGSSGQGGTAGFKAAKAVAPAAILKGAGLRASRGGWFVLRIACPAGSSGCQGTVTVRTLGAVVAAPGSRASVLKLAGAGFNLPGGQVGTTRLRLTARARTLLARKGSVRVRVSIVAHDASGASAVTHATATLHGVRG